MALPAIDWNEAWKKVQVKRRDPDDSSFWDKRAPSFAKKAGSSSYTSTFIDWAGLKEGETVFDMGAGSGTLALPLARAGHRVVAGDFSPVMLEILEQRAHEENLDHLITTHKVSWDEDWSALDLPVCDVAFASRSIATDDLKEALIKLDSRARRRVCLTLSDGHSPRCDKKLAEVMGRDTEFAADYIFSMNLLWSMGIEPELRFIDSPRSNAFASYEEAIEKTSEAFNPNAEELSALEKYTREHLHEVEYQGEPMWRYDHDRVTRWGFISWNK